MPPTLLILSQRLLRAHANGVRRREAEAEFTVSEEESISTIKFSSLLISLLITIKISTFYPFILTQEIPSDSAPSPCPTGSDPSFYNQNHYILPVHIGPRNTV